MASSRLRDSLRRSLGSIAALLSAFGIAASGHAQNRPNILVIIADDLGVDGVGVYGEGANPAPTPNIDALAARGVLFRNAWVNPLCSPTRACIQTGRYTHRTLVGDLVEMGGRELSLDETTLPEVFDLAGSGYRHALIGKWHLGETQGGKLAPNLAGWSHFAGFFDGKTTYFFWDRTVDGVTGTVPTYTTTQMVDDALDWIGEQQNPWLCMVAFNAPHTPLTAPPRSLHTQRLPDVAPELAPVPFFRATVEAMDTEIGRMFATLGPALDHTWVIFMSDNGAGAWAVQPPFVGSHGKGTPYEGGTRVPLIIAGPDVRAPGREVDALVAGVDVFTTVADMAGIAARRVVPSWQELDGVSMLPYLLHPEQTPLRDTVFAEIFTGTTWASVNANGFATVRDARFKLIRTFIPGPGESAQKDELYDLREDPFEARDLLQGPLTADQAARYHALVVALRQQRRPRGTWHELGAPECAGSGGVLRIDVSGAPAIGRSHRVLLHDAAPGTPALLLVGTSSTQWSGVPLPLALEPFGAGHGCVLRGSGESAMATRIDDRGDASVAIDVPADLALVGTVLFHSWLDFDPAAPGALGLTVSDTAVAVLGLPDAPPVRDEARR